VRKALSCLAFLALALRTAHADCPVSTFFYGALDPAIPIVKVAPRVDTVFSIQSCDGVHGRYDIPAGLLIASIDHACSGDLGGAPSGLETVVEDDYELVGMPPGTPVAFDAVLHLKGDGHDFGPPGGGGGARLRATLLEGVSNSTSLLRATTGLDPAISIDEPLTLPISAVAGTPVHLRVAVRAEAFDGRGELEGLLGFTVLPPGAFLHSCRGYLSDAPVAARRTSWGRLKAVYR